MDIKDDCPKAQWKIEKRTRNMFMYFVYTCDKCEKHCERLPTAKEKKIGMDNQELNKIIHDHLLPIQQSFKSYEKLAGNGFHFSHQIFRKCALHIQEVIEIVKELAEEK